MNLLPIISNFKGRYIVFEGMNESGKTTIIERFKKDLKAQGLDKDTLFISEPDSEEVEFFIREILLDKDLNLNRFSETLLFMVARNELIKRNIYPALEQFKMVISDRSYISSLVYHPHSIKDDDRLFYSILEKIIERNIVVIVYLDIDSATCIERLKAKGKQDVIESIGQLYYQQVEKSYTEIIDSLTGESQEISTFDGVEIYHNKEDYRFLIRIDSKRSIDEVYKNFTMALSEIEDYEYRLAKEEECHDVDCRWLP